MTVSPIDTLRMTRRLRDAGLTQAQSEEIALYVRDTTALTQADLARRGEVEHLQLTLGDGLEGLRRDFDFMLSEVAALVRILRSEVMAAQDRAARRAVRANRLLMLMALMLMLVAAATGAVAVSLFDVASGPDHAASHGASGQPPASQSAMA